MDRPHVVVVTFPAQGHINPGLQLAKRVMGMGVEVTLATSVFAQRQMAKSSTTPKGLNFATYSDGYDEGYRRGDIDAVNYMSQLVKRTSNTLRDVIHTSAEEGRPVSCLLYTLLLPWLSEVARECHIPSALLWIQPAFVFDLYYYYFYGFEDEIKTHSANPSWSIQFPGLPVLKSRDLPSFLLPSCPDMYKFALPTFKQQFETLDQEDKPKVLVNTFDALESEALRAIEKYEMIAIGPLIPSAFLDGKDPTDTSYSGDLFQKSEDYMDWLSSKPTSSVVYVSFGSLLTLPKQQMDQIAKALLDSGKPFLWVIREKEKEGEEKEEEKLSYMEELEERGMIVPWCSQLEVLTHPSLGCFVTHCGWNSTLESLSCGVPLVAFPQWTDQGTNAKLIEDIWKTGVRVNSKEDGLVESHEIKRCIELVMGDGDEGVELRRNAKKWKELARDAVIEGGSSANNLKRFLEEVGKGF